MVTRREALTFAGRGGAAGLLAATAVMAVQCQPIEAPAAEAVTDPMLAALQWHYQHEVILDGMTFSASDEEYEAYRVDTVDRIRALIIEDKPQITSDEGARTALYTALTSGYFVDPFTHRLVLQTLRYLERRAA